MKKLLPTLALLIIVGCSSFTPQIKEMPLLIGTTFNGKNFDLSTKRGKIIIISFWTSWSLECQKELLFLNEFSKKNNSKTLQIVGISLDDEVNRQAAFRTSYSLNYPNIFVEDIEQNDLDKPQNLPTSYLLDQKGRIFKIYDNRKDLEKHLEEDTKKLLGKENQELNKNHAVRDI